MSGGTLVYQYGLLRPSADDRALIEREMRGGHNLRNDFTAIVRAEREALRRAEVEIDPTIEALRLDVVRLDSEIVELLDVIKGRRATTRTRETAEELRDQVRRLRVKRGDANRAFHARRREAAKDPRMQVAKDAIDDKRKALWNSANTRSTDYSWRTAGSRAAAVQQARKKPFYDGPEADDPRFARWTGEGQIGGQINTGGGVELDGIENASGIRMVLRDNKEIEILPEEKRRGPEDDGRRRCLSTFSMQVGKRDSLAWVSWPMVYHRPIPKGATITHATVNLRRIGRKERWTVQLTLKLVEARTTPVNGGAVAVDLGWKKDNSAIVPGAKGWLRLASWVGDDGQRGHLWLDDHAIGGLTKANELRGVRDKNFEPVRDALATWLAGRVDLPKWLAEARQFLPQWKSQERLRRLAERWKTDRFDGDAEAFDALEAWRYHDEHLWNWEANQRESSLLDRRERLRVLSAKLASQYSTVLFSDVDYRSMAKSLDEEDEGDNGRARTLRHLAAPGVAREIISGAFKARGGQAIQLDAKNMTIDCHMCGHRNERPEGATSSICGGCGKSRDMDHNLALNLLRAHREGRSAAPKAGAARKREKVLNPDGSEETPYQRRARMMKAKKERLEAAREADAMAAE